MTDTKTLAERLRERARYDSAVDPLKLLIEAADALDRITPPPAELRVGDVAWARVRIDTDVTDDGWCFCTPANPPEDVARGLMEEWEEGSQFFGQVVAADALDRITPPPAGPDGGEPESAAAIRLASMPFEEIARLERVVDAAGKCIADLEQRLADVKGGE